jgi:hypothetical protein
MSINNSEHYIDDLALTLDENINGANGEMSDKQIRIHLMQTIIEQCNYSIAGHSGIDEPWIEMTIAEHEHQPALTLSQTASMIMRVWLHKERQVMEEIMSSLNPPPSVAKLPDIIGARLANGEAAQ